VNVNVYLSPDFLQRLEKLQGWERACLRAGGTAAYEYLVEYHKNMDWRGSQWMPSANSGEFQRKVWTGWQPPKISGYQVVITNTFGLLDWKINGGVILPKAAKALTIPLISAARGVLAGAFGEPLFIRGNTLSRRIGSSIEAVYALKLSVAQGPWPGAMPPDEDLKGVFEKASYDELVRIASR
jgi:hypothetical protein